VVGAERFEAGELRTATMDNERGPRKRRRAVAIGLALAASMVVAQTPAAFATFPGRNGRIAFLCSCSRHIVAALYTMEPDGSGVVRITGDLAESSQRDSTFEVTAPAWSPDGTRIAYAGLPLPTTDIFTSDALGRDVKNLTRDDATEVSPSWSPSGDRLVVERRASPMADTNIFRMTADGTNPVALTGRASEDLRPDWSPDSSSIAFDSNRSGDFEIYSMAPDGSGISRIVRRPGHFDADPSWSPDGAEIAFESSTRHGTAIFTMNADGTGVRKLTNGRSNNRSPSWSPDGTKIAFESDRRFGSHIFIIDAEGRSHARKVTRSRHEEDVPAWQSVP
jgi:Tol biopolymer transport system component